jgi:hypothetical protein
MSAALWMVLFASVKAWPPTTCTDRGMSKYKYLQNVTHAK